MTRIEADTHSADRASDERFRAAEIERRCAAARERLERKVHGEVPPVAHFRRPVERAFTAGERDRVTILFGGLTATHERLIQAVFTSAGYSSRPLPEADLAACHVGKQYCNNGVCNPAYFTIGALVRFLQQLEAEGLTRQEIVDRYVFFTAGSCGPCRFGMYEAEYRLALRNAGFEGFRVLLFQQEQGVHADTGEPGLKLSLHLGLGAVNAFNFADALLGFGYDVRPYETTPGLTDRRIAQAEEAIAATLEARRHIDPAERLPPWIVRVFGHKWTNVLVNVHAHLYGRATATLVNACRAPLDDIEVDRLRVKPVVKVTGEFWAQTTEGDGNFRMFSFLEREGAHALIEPLGGWIMYLLEYVRIRGLERRGLDIPKDAPALTRLAGRIRGERRIATRLTLIRLGEKMYRHQYDRLRRALGLPHPLLDQRELGRLADPYYRQLARGGEGHLEVAKNIYYSTHHAAHMVLSLKPFGCMPSTQSDGVQSSIIARFPETTFLAVETGAEGELAAHSRVQMALVDARLRAQAEFQRALASTGRTLDEVRRYVDDHPDLRRATYGVPHRPGIAGIAANFVLHVSDLMRGGRHTRSTQAATPEARQGA